MFSKARKALLGVKHLMSSGSKTTRPTFHKLLRMSSNEPCAPNASDGQKPPPQEPCPPKTEQPPPSCCPPIPPCPPMPRCPPAICPQVADPNNPCNYCPPPCIDPDYPDLTKLKKLQCHFQKEDGTPVFLKKGTSDAVLFQVTLILVLVSLAGGIYNTYKLRK